MNANKTLLALSASLLLAGATEAQIILRNFYNTQTRGSAFDRSVGNSYLGGNLHAHISLQTSVGTMTFYQRSTLDMDARASVNLLTATRTLADVSANLNAVGQTTGQTRTGRFRVQILGYDYINSSFASNTNFAQRTWTFNVFPSDPSISVPVGPVSVSLRGNVGAGLITGANYQLPVTSLQVGAYGSIEAYGTAHASVGIGIPGFSLGVGVSGRIVDQTLAVFCGANVNSGFFGAATYSLVPISLRLYAYAEAFWYTWTTTLTSWSSAAITRSLL